MRARRTTLADRIRSTELLFQLLSEIVSAPSAYLSDSKLANALRNQSTLAAYASPARRIVPMCLNHQKELAIRVLGSYETLNTLRHSALTAIVKAAGRPAPAPGPGSKSDLKARLELAESSAETLRCDLVLLQRAFDARCSQALAYAHQIGPLAVEKWRREQKEIEATFSLMRSPRSNRVSNLDDARHARSAK